MRPEMRNGFALPAALLALIIVGGLVTVGMSAAMAEDRSSGNVEFGQIAFAAAEQGMQELLGTKTRPYFEGIGAVGTADTIGPVDIEIGGIDAQYTVYVQRIATRLFMVESEGAVLSGGRYAGSSRRIAELMRIQYTYVPKDRAYTTQAEVRIRGQSAISGDDLTPANWAGCESGMGTQKAVVSSDTSTVDVPPGGGGNSGLIGNPKMDENASLDSLNFVQYGDMHLDDLKSYAEKIIPSGTYPGVAAVETGGVCDEDVLLNWGDPNNAAGACHEYWPIIHATGDLKLSGAGVGQGILIVDGNLEISGGFEFNGLVFVYGNIKATGTGNKFSGSVNVLGATGYSDLGVTGAGNTKIHLSSCAIERAHRYNTRFARPIPLAERSFVDLSGIGAY